LLFAPVVVSGRYNHILSGPLILAFFGRGWVSLIRRDTYRLRKKRNVYIKHEKH